MRPWTTLSILFLFATISPPWSLAQQDQKGIQAERKVVNKVVPAYPDLARQMNLHGVVNLEAAVDPGGAVKDVKVIGGNPVLAQAAEKAIHKWKWAPATTDTREPIQIRFDQR